MCELYLCSNLSVLIHTCTSNALEKKLPLYLEGFQMTWHEHFLSQTARQSETGRDHDFHILVRTLHYLLSAILICSIPKIAASVPEPSRYTHTAGLEDIHLTPRISPLGHAGCNLQVKPLSPPRESLPWPQSGLTDWVIKNTKLMRQAGQWGKTGTHLTVSLAEPLFLRQVNHWNKSKLNIRHLQLNFFF